jgi:hypothetical protein
MPNRNTNGQFMYSPADDLASVPSPGAHTNPGQPSVYPDISMTDKSGDSAPGSKQAESFGGESETVSTGGAAGASLATGPTEPSADLGPVLGGDLNSIPRPSGSY